jgi:hypothetical protein
MGDEELVEISSILNRSEFKVLAWSMNEYRTRKSGLLNIEFIG